MSKMYAIIVCVMLCATLGSGCQSANSKTVSIRGNLKGLPDGKLLLLTTRGVKIDSSEVTNGKFNFSLDNNRYTEPMFLTLVHIDKTGIKRLFSFRTHKLYNGQPWNFEYFILEESDIVIDGQLDESTLKFGSLGSNVKLVSPKEFIKAGKQTQALYSITTTIPQTADSATVARLIDTVKKYPYSYYVLSEINDHISSFTNVQAETLIASFDQKMQKNPIVSSIRKHFAIRSYHSLGLSTELVDTNNQKRNVLDSTKRLNVVILWASWCAPCKKEIPDLKKLYKKYATDKTIRFVSVSLDTKRENWMNSLKTEQMPWEQLLVPAALSAYSSEIFNIDGTVPTTLFIDGAGHFIEKIVGNDSNTFQRYSAFIDKYIKR